MGRLVIFREPRKPPVQGVLAMTFIQKVASKGARDSFWGHAMVRISEARFPPFEIVRRYVFHNEAKHPMVHAASDDRSSEDLLKSSFLGCVAGARIATDAAPKRFAKPSKR